MFLINEYKAFNGLHPSLGLTLVLRMYMWMIPTSIVIQKKRATRSRLIKKALDKVVLPALFNVVNNIVQHC